MKIYVSDKEIDNNNLNYVEDDFVEEYWLLRGRKEEDGFEVHDDVGLCEVISLEQHYKELLKEFALEFITQIWNIQIQTAIDFENKIRKMLKERGIE